jgi:putative peptide zinc metalloprotease protein
VEAATGTVAPPALDPAGRRLSGYPRRAEGLELLGEMPGSGYRQAPALARRRDGQVIKLTGLLYQLIESIDGRRDYDELAAELTRRAGKRATASDVEYLLEHKLRPLGVLREADGAEPAVAKANPLLALRLRAILTKPQLTRLITAPFTWLFSPVVVIPVVAGFALLCWWLVTDKGLASPLHQAFYDPAMILVVWALIIAGAAFHEIGHAAACRYGGARPGVMGAGLYLAWPVFYTEVSDAYRLDRRGRLRVDLGGLYFNAIFALVTAGFWAMTGADAVLLVIAILLAQMVRQLAPFIRADGYHILADLTGVPDLFAHIKPTLLGLLPTRWGRMEQHRLKPWARVLVSAWVLIIAPLLAGMLVYFVLVLPRLAATAWDSMGLEWAAATASWSDGDPVAVVVSVLSAGLVALPVLGISYLLWGVARRAAKRTWTATADRPLLRTTSMLVAVGVVGLIAWAWWPSSDRYQPIRADEPGPVPAVAPQVSGAVPSLQVVSATEPLRAGTDPSAPSPSQSRPTADPLQAPAANPRFGDSPARRVSQPAETGSGDRSAWPFPFDPPDPPGPGDNQALAVNTQDNSLVWDVAMSLLVLTQGAPVDETNEAYALASCEACTTVAVAFQVILIVGYVDEITPENTAVAVNYNCDTCTTAAFAYQLVVTALEAPSPELVQQLSIILQRLQELEANRESLTIEQIYLALEAIEDDVLEALAASGADTDALAAPENGTPSEPAGEAPSDTPTIPTETPPASEQPTSSDPAPSDQPTTETTPTETTPAPSTTDCSTRTDPSSDPSCTSTTETTTTSEPAPAP